MAKTVAKYRRAWLVGALAAVTCAAAAQAQQAGSPDGTSSEIVVFGRAEAKIGVAHAASEGTISGADLLVRPLVRTAELLEAVPGMVAAQHSGSGKANQYFLRGFNLDHGSDFTTYIDGVQMNFRSHGHGQGYLDLNGLIPEIVDREDFRKGPYRADGGDFALAGAAYMTTIARFDRPWVSAEGGSFGAARVAAGGTIATSEAGLLTLAAQAKIYDGPWQLAERLRHFSGFARYSVPLGADAFDLSLHGYRGTWRPTEQIPERIIGSAICPDAFCSPDPTAIGATTRLIANARVTGERWQANVYAQFYDWNMLSNPTYADASGASAQIDQFDRRWIFGFGGNRQWSLAPWADLNVGTEGRLDVVTHVGVDQTAARQRVAALGTYSLNEGSTALHGEATLRPVAGLRIIAGLRGDLYHVDVHAKDGAALALGEGRSDQAIVSPKFSAAWSPAAFLELYANWGRGFHSNDARGVVNRATPVPLLVRGTGKEAGARIQRGGFSFTATYWWLDIGSELRFVGDSNAVEPTGASTRRGYELVAFWRPRPWLAIDGSFTASHSRYDNDDRIPNAFENAASGGVSIVLDRWEASVRARHLGPSPLIEDNSVRDRGSTVVNLRGAWKGKGVQLYAELLNALNSRDKDITYYYESYVPEFDAAPVEGRLSRIIEPRTLRVGAKLMF
jgi:hypothetical protein